jgi:hypothetical protein
MIKTTNKINLKLKRAEYKSWMTWLEIISKHTKSKNKIKNKKRMKMKKGYSVGALRLQMA